MKPEADTTLFIGSQYLITWEDNLSNGRYDITLYDDTLLAYNIGISFSAKNYLWTIYPSVEPGNNYRVIVRDMNTDIIGKSDVFSISYETYSNKLSGYLNLDGMGKGIFMVEVKNSRMRIYQKLIILSMVNNYNICLY